VHAKNYRDPAGWTTAECRIWRQVAVAAPMGETKSLRKLATDMSVAAKDCCSVAMVAISWIWQRGNTRKNPLKDCRGEILWIGLLQDRARKVFGIIGPAVEGKVLCVALVRFSPRLGFCW